MLCTLCTKRGIPCICSLTATNAFDACQQAHESVCLLSAPSNHEARGVLSQDTLASTPLWSTMMKPYPSANGHWDLKQANGNDSRQLALSPQALICPPPLLGHHPMVTSLLDLRKVIIWPMKDGNGERTFKLGPIVTMSCHQWDSNAKLSFLSPPYLIYLHAIILTFFHYSWSKTPQQDSPVCSLPRELTPQQPTPGLKPSRTKEPPISGLSPSSQPPEDNTTREPEPEVAPTQSTEEPFGKSQFHFFNSTQLFLIPPLTISSFFCHSPLHHYHQQYAHCTMTLARNSLTYFDDSLSHCPRIKQLNLVGALPLAPHDSFCGCNSSK
ncbi:hypothetical protein O181_062553 [Austropuccinia psidii MF-1]|uniref:Uncharacterized protein n=1 Tax=Austropuccinia psidii MF-1 TaxID=1389203 RepID=A0A9Q3EPY6_9BASI|nr:hypothetical protein [Austropuccinia psidii MF-1]